MTLGEAISRLDELDRDTVKVLGVVTSHPPSLDEKLRLLLHYAEHDAYPDWVHER
jgi:hypothetical protein